MIEPLGLFLTWGTYGAWLPGDARGWVEYRRGWQFPNPVRELEASAIMTEDAGAIMTEDVGTVMTKENGSAADGTSGMGGES